MNFDTKGRFTHSMPFPCHAVPLRVYNVSLPFDLHSAAVSDSHLPCHGHVERRPCCAVALRRTAWSEHVMESVNRARPHCVNQMGKTHSKPSAARHGRGTACYVWIGLQMFITENEGRPAVEDCRSTLYSDKVENTRCHQVQQQISHISAFD